MIFTIVFFVGTAGLLAVVAWCINSFDAHPSTRSRSAMDFKPTKINPEQIEREARHVYAETLAIIIGGNANISASDLAHAEKCASTAQTAYLAKFAPPAPAEG